MPGELRWDRVKPSGPGNENACGGGRTLRRWLKVMKRPDCPEGASGWEPFGVATAAQHNQAQRDRPFRAESPNRSGQASDMSRWESGRQPEEDPELYRGSLYEPPYSIWEAAVGSTGIVIGSLLFRWLWGQ
jgi:hypothetical protein